MARNGKGNNNSEKGFAALKKNDPERLSEIAAEGGRAAHESGNAHEFDSREAREAGKKGGENSRGGNQGRQSGNSGGRGR
jgi:general stress protein YciG